VAKPERRRQSWTLDLLSPRGKGCRGLAGSWQPPAVTPIAQLATAIADAFARWDRFDAAGVVVGVGGDWAAEVLRTIAVSTGRCPAS